MRDKKYKITILNWDKYQREMKGGENRRRRREWIAISVDLNSDPDYLALDQTHRCAWVGLLCHAGKVGPSFELSPSDARLLFRLRRSPDFEVFKKQGFIDLRTATNKTVQNKTNSKPQPKKATPAKTAESRFPDFWKVYPKKKDKIGAEKIWDRDKLDPLADKIIADVQLRPTADPDWKDPQFIPYPSTYLNRKRWTDELKSVATFKPRKPEVVSEETRQRDRERADRELAALGAK